MSRWARAGPTLSSGVLASASLKHCVHSLKLLLKNPNGGGDCPEILIKYSHRIRHIFLKGEEGYFA